MATDPKARAREAFADLPTPEKTAFVIEATFSTIGAALRETGQRLADVITEFDPDAFFRDHESAHEETEADAPAPAAPRKTAAKKATATKSGATKKTTSRKTTGTKKTPRKTAGRKKKDEDS
ncbi:MAG: hypothetical protein AAGI52_12545 [Bacteroidota bacterium]